MNVTTVYELFSVIMQETFQHNSDFQSHIKRTFIDSRRCRLVRLNISI